MKQTRELIDKIIDPTGVSSMRLSPDGRYLAEIAWTGFGNALLLVDTLDGSARSIYEPRYLRGWTAAIQPMAVHWISNDLMAVDFNNRDCDVLDLHGHFRRQLGDHFVHMLAPESNAATAKWALVDAQGPFGNVALRRINVETGEFSEVPVGLPGTVQRRLFDHQGRLRVATTQETQWFVPGAKVTNWYRHDDQSPWQQLAQAPVTEDLWIPVAVDDNADKLDVLSREGRDTWALFAYDVASRRTTELRAGHPTEDLTFVDEDEPAGLLRVTTEGLKPRTYWMDSRWSLLQRSVDAALPGAVNVLDGNPHGKVVVLSYSDRDPGTWYLLDSGSMKMSEIARRQSVPDAFPSRPLQTLTYPAFDGLTIPAYLTLPAGGTGPYPMVVYIHGGPMERDYWGWDHDDQLFAAAGYAVFQPQFRGSSGFGRKFEQAGYHQWGLAMQDDVTAGVKAMIDRGIADPRRICIYGASYGGYAALWGLVKTPDLYQCGISLAGVTDIGERFTDWSDTNASKIAKEDMRFTLGDIDTMAAQFNAVSPEKHAADIRVPVLLAHGTDDRRVPIGHSKRMAQALERAHKSVEVHWYDDEGHGLHKIADIRDFDAAVLDFLDRLIGPASPSAPTRNDNVATGAKDAPH